MLRRVEVEDQRPRAEPPPAAAIAPEQAIVPIAEADTEQSLLPRDHPKWAHDAVTLSQRAREIVAALRPVVVKILTFWDHRVRSVFIGGSRVSIDPSG
ncbi:MAG TPA: hypothetical protein VMA98_11625, partial [Candidatus Acidoferrales bacterium]|nr:hypothetical protein [Candidatus Acidoferrales bacterium]